MWSSTHIFVLLALAGLSGQRNLFELQNRDCELPLAKATDRIISSDDDIRQNALRQQGIDDPDTIATITIKFYYTRQFAEATDNISLFLDQLIADTNQGYINSLIPVRIKIHCIEATNLNDSNGTKIWQDIQQYKGSISELRGGADVTALILHKFLDDYCGIGRTGAWSDGGTLIVLAKDCIGTPIVLGHELAHNFGCHHDRVQWKIDREKDNNKQEELYSYGYGSYLFEPYISIMGYRNGNFNKYVNYYSSSVAKFQGKVTGSASEDCARVIRENRFLMAAVGDESETCSIKLSSSIVKPLGNCPQGWVVSERTESCFKIIEHRTDWDTANNTCASMNAELASIRTQQEFDFINDLLRKTGENEFWLGGNDLKQEGIFKWTDGSDVTFNGWNRNEPNDFNNNEDCMVWWGYANGKWNDAACKGWARLKSLCKIQGWDHWNKEG